MKRLTICFILLLFGSNVFSADRNIDVDNNKATDIASGGTNATTAANARTNLGVPSTASTLVGDCTVGPCLNGSSNGGTLIKLWAGTGSYWTALQGGAPAANRSWRLPIAAAPAAGETLVMTMDEYGQMGFLAAPSTSGYVLTSTDDGVLSWAAGGSGYTDEQAQDTVCLMLSGNTETGITVTCDDVTGKINFVSPTTLASFTDDATHRTVSDTEKTTWNAKQDAVSTSPLTVSMVTRLFSGAEDCLGANGETVACGGSVSFAFDTFPTYSDSPHSSGIAKNNTHVAIYSGETNGWGVAALTFSLNPTPIAPTLTNRVIGTDGTTLTITGSASLSVGAGGSSGFDVDCTLAGNDIALSNPQGFPGTSITYTIAKKIIREADGESCNLDYTQPGNGIEATTGGGDLVSITSAAVTNSSTQVGGVSDTFDTDSSSNYTAISGSGLYINTAEGYAEAGAAWTPARYYNETSTGGNNNYAEGVVERSLNATTGLIVRSNGTTGYALQVYHNGSQINLISFNGSAETYVGTFSSSLALGATPRLRLEADGSNFSLYLHNGTTFDKVGSTISDSTYDSGEYIGFYSYNGEAKAKIYSIAGGQL